ncbi:MAG: GNAT family N-acetyltransferase [Caldilineaceae bacterium]
MQIHYLADKPEHIPQLAEWHHAFWGHLNPGATLEKRIASLQKQAQIGAIPTAFVATDGDATLGSTSLVINDLSTHPHLTPWLASVYVAAPYRRRGVGGALVRRVMQEAGALGVETLHLITPDQQRFYAGLGWQEWMPVEYRGETVTIMRYRPE